MAGEATYTANVRKRVSPSSRGGGGGGGSPPGKFSKVYFIFLQFEALSDRFHEILKAIFLRNLFHDRGQYGMTFEEI